MNLVAKRNLRVALLPLAFGLALFYCSASALGGPFFYPPDSQPTTLSGSVVDTSGAPIVGAWVMPFCPCMYDFCNEMMPYNTGPRVATDINGHYSIELPESGPALVGVLDGYRKSVIVPVDLSPTSTHLDLELGASDGSLLVFGWGVEEVDGVWQRSSGATIRLGSGETTISAADGFFSLVTDEATDTMSVSKPGFYTDTSWWGNALGMVDSGDTGFSLYPIMSRYPGADTVTLQSHRGSAKYTLSALLTRAPSIPAGNATVCLERYVARTKRWSTIAALKTNRSGRARRSLRSRKRTVNRYRWYAPPVGRHGKVTTPTQKVVVN